MWRRGAWHGGHQQQGRNRDWVGPTERPPPRYGRPPPSSPSPSSGTSHRPVPLWEKKFCTDVCRIPWRRICDAKDFMGWYDDIVKWNDSAGEEAFRNAKARYWAEINGLHCDIPLPDPDMHTDIIDEAPFIDTQLAADLEDAYKEPSESSPGGSSGIADQPKSLSRVEHGDENVNYLHSYIPIVADKLVPMAGYIDLKDIVPDGWGDDTEAKPQTANGDNNLNSGCAANSINQGKGCDEYVGFVDKSIPITKHINAWNQNSGWGATVVQDGCDAWNQSSGWDRRVFQGSWISGRDNSQANKGKYSWRHWKNRNNEPDRSYGRNQNGSHFGSRYPNQRCQGEDRQTYNNWRNCGGKNQIDDDYNRSVQDKPPQATGQWKSKHYFGSMNHQRSGKKQKGEMLLSASVCFMLYMSQGKLINIHKAAVLPSFLTTIYSQRPLYFLLVCCVSSAVSAQSAMSRIIIKGVAVIEVVKDLNMVLIWSRGIQIFFDADDNIVSCILSVNKPIL